ncbi:MAG TPA: alpha/beta hydrolase [Blastocatellia bacterium]|nr:alpha/beta hydrolase [Blastocatellia bacterium]
MKAQTTPEEKPIARRPRRWLRILKRVIITLVIIIIILIYGVLPFWLSGLVTSAGTRSMDRQLTTTPASLGAEYKDIEFQTSDGVTISGWLLPSRGTRATIIYSHGLFRSRRELLDRAVELWRLGYGALLYDSRNHGESGKAKVSLGYFERLDAEAAARYLQEASPNTRIIMFGISMGAATALLAAAETPEVRAVISDSSFLSFEDTTTHHVKLFLKLPAFPLANEIRFMIEKRAGFDGSKLDALEAVKALGTRPAMFIAAQYDPRMPADIGQKLYDASAATTKRDLLIVDGPGAHIHGHAYQADPRLYVERVAAFLDSALRD